MHARIWAEHDRDSKGREGYRIESEVASLVAWVPVGFGTVEEAQQFAYRIVRAVNLHDEATAALAAFVERCDREGLFQRGRYHKDGAGDFPELIAARHCLAKL